MGEDFGHGQENSAQLFKNVSQMTELERVSLFKDLENFNLELQQLEGHKM